MKEAILIYFILILGCFGAASQTNTDNITYDFSCMEDDIFSAIINLSSDLEKEILGSIGEDVPISEEMKYGDSAFAEIKKEYTIISEGSQNSRIQAILKKLILKINSPKGFKYILYLIESEEINAFTIGGRIYITTAMVAFCVSDHEIACIIGHEIAHNELGHIRDGISRVKTARSYGVVGDVSASFASLATSSFNQKNEVHSDFIGIDLATAAGYDGCASSRLWSRMKSQETSSNILDSFFSSHPFSSKRETCANSHIVLNYKIKCD
jgi:predicted Zn-dependent protease